MALRLIWTCLQSSQWTRSVLVSGALVLCAVEKGAAEVAMAIGQNFTASTLGVDSDLTPADCNGAPGLAHYVEMINGRFSVYLKADASLVQTKATVDFWAAAGLSLTGVDPRLVFDASVQRWFALSINANNVFLLAISAGADPTGGWSGVAFPIDTGGTYKVDYPTLGIDSQGVFLAVNLVAVDTYVGSVVVSIPKTDLLVNPPVISRRTASGFLGGTNYGWVLQPVVNQDATSTLANVLAVGDLGYDFKPHSTLVGTSIGGVNSSNAAVLSPPTTINVPSYLVPLDPPQPDGSTNLDDLDSRFTANVYQVNGILYAVHTTQVGPRAAVRWYRLGASDFALLESGTIADPKLDLFYPSIAANASGTVVLAFNGCSTNQFVSIYAMAGQTIGNTTTFGNLVLIKAGAASYQQPGATISRWGDYSTLAVDPVDSNRFWTIQMYPSSGSAWSTQITELLTASAQLSIKPSGGNVTVCWPGTTGVYDLQATPSLSSPSWTTVSNTNNTTTSGGQVCATVPVGGNAMFFRLLQRGL